MSKTFPKKTVKFAFFILFALSFAAPLQIIGSNLAHATSVNGETISSKAIKKRAALMRLMRTKGAGTAKAKRELIDDTIRLQEAKRLRVAPSEAEVNKAFASFAKNNKMSVANLKQILARSGVTTAGFKDFIRVQMAWPRVVAAKAKAERANISQDKILRDLRASGKPKPVAKEFFLQQVIFVVPAKKRSRLKKRLAEARAFRKKFQTCENTKQLAVGTLDVSVRSIGRKLAPEVPEIWRNDLENLSAGGTTSVRATDKGAEFLAVCSVKEVSDDKAAVLMFMDEQRKNSRGDKLSKKYFAELKAAAQIN